MTNVHHVIRASAGSGKTYQLTRRYLALLKAGAEPDVILATTFTRKAAGEILGRVLSDLATDHDYRDALRRVARCLHRLSISTIDSFFNRIASSFRFELDVPPDPQLMEEGHPIAHELRREAIESMLGEAGESDDGFDTLLGLLRRLHHDAAARSITDAIDTIVSDLYGVYRDAPDREKWSRIEAPDLLDNAALRAAIKALLNGRGELPTHKSWHSGYDSNCEHALRRDWESFLDKGPAKAVLAGNETYYNKRITPGIAAMYQPLVAHAGAALIDRVAKQTEATHELLHRFDGHYTKLRRQFRVLLFSDLAHKLARRLPDAAPEMLDEIYFRLDGRVTHLLLDEFQDTSLDQWAVLAPFAEEVASHSDGSRSFFCVGDAKQAIYGWRGGCAELFDKVEQLPGVTIEHLARSYRSSPVVLDAVNQAFANIADCAALAEDRAAAEAWQRDFQPHEAEHINLPGYVRLETSPAASSVPSSDVEGEPVFTAHEQFAAERIGDLHRQAPAHSVGVLVATNKMVNLMLYELRKLMLPVSGEGGNPVSDQPAVAAVLSALQLADHPGDSAAAFHVANSPVGQVLGMTSTAQNETRRVAIAVRHTLLNDGYARTIADWTTQLAPHCDRQSLARLVQLVELAEQYDPAATLRPSRFVEYVEAMRVEEPAPAPIRVMTIHKAKGLEFDTVVLPELDKRLSNVWSILVERPAPTEPITGVYRYASSEIRDQIEPIARAYDARRAAQRHDDLCALYVAMTRAKHALHMVVKPLQSKSDGTSRSSGLCYAALLREKLSNVEESFDGVEVLYERGDPSWPGETKPAEALPKAEPLSVKLASEQGGARRSWLTVSPSSLRAGGRVTGASLLTLREPGGFAYGSLIHAWFEKVGFVDEQGGVPRDDELDGGDAETIATFRRMLESTAIKQELQRNGATDLWRERPFAVRLDNQLLRGVFDRVAIRDGGATLIDYKTDACSDEAVEMYRPQIDAYRWALAIMLRCEPIAIDAKLLFVGDGKVVEL